VSPEIEPTVLLEFMRRLGQAYLACHEQTAEVERRLRDIASAYGMPGSRVVAFPTAVFIVLHDGQQERMTLAEGPAQGMRLDQMADVYTLGEAAGRAEVTPKEGLERLGQILRRTTRFGFAGKVLGHTILTIGIAMVLKPTLANLAAAAFLGAIVGALKAREQRGAVLTIPLPVIAATLVSTLVFYAVRHGLPVDPLHVLVPPLVTFLPGAMLTLGMIELAYGDMVSGASRLTTGFVQLVLLALGLAAGAAIVGFGPADLMHASEQIVTMPWAAWAGVVIFGLGVYLHFSAPRKSLPWMLAVMLLAFSAQWAAAGLFGGWSGFFGMLVATPLSLLIQLRLSGPPALVTFLPSFWLVVPGALGLLSVTRMLSDRAAGLEGLVTVTTAIASVALGTLVGAALYKGTNEQFGRLLSQAGRVGAHVRRRSSAD
jgi:uncharacterized membrane protein YjjP (DUF1212 family)